MAKRETRSGLPAPMPRVPGDRLAGQPAPAHVKHEGQLPRWLDPSASAWPKDRVDAIDRRLKSRAGSYEVGERKSQFAAKFTPALEAKALLMLGAGATAVEVGKALGVHEQTIRKIAKRPDNARLVAELRERNKLASAEALQRLTPSLWGRLEQA